MPGETELSKLLKTIKPVLNTGEYVFCTVTNTLPVDFNEAVMFFKEKEGITIVLEKQVAEKYQLPCSFVASWITLTVHSSLEAVGLTAAFSKALSNENISCNVVAGYYHDHIFVNPKDAEKAMMALIRLSENELHAG